MKQKLLGLFLLLSVLLAACAPAGGEGGKLSDPIVTDDKDYVSLLTLNMDSETAKAEATVKTFVDGDTTHFYVDDPAFLGGVFKARYLAVDTPESTGKIEEYGKKASSFTKEKLSSAVSIILESDSETWEKDSTGSRTLSWVWYKTEGMTEYRNLNLEILQNGLALASNTGGNRYGDTCLAALNQAKNMKRNIYSGQPDPDFYYGSAVELTLKELRSNPSAYEGVKVAFKGIVSTNSGTQGVYVEDFDAESGLYYGIYIYYGHSLSGAGLDVLTVGNEARIVGTVQYYEGGGTWQVSDLNYRMMKPNDPDNVQKLSSGHSAAYTPITVSDFVDYHVTLELEDEAKTVPLAEAILNTSVSMENLKVTDAYTTEDEDSSSFGAMTLTCQQDGKTVNIRTSVFTDESGNLITQDAYLGKTISVKGIVDYFDGAYQVKVFTPQNITIK